MIFSIKYMKSIDWPKVWFNVNKTLALSSAFVLCFYTFVFMTGYHNFDLGQNAAKLNDCRNLTLADKVLGIDGRLISMSPGDMVALGAKQMMEGFLSAITAALVCGYTINGLRRKS